MTELSVKPRAVTIAVFLALGVSAAGVVQAINAFLERRNLATGLTEAGKYMNIDQAIYRTINLKGSVTLALFLGICAAVLMAALSLALSQGRRWARVLTWIVGGGLIVGELILMAADSSAVKTGTFVRDVDVPGGNLDTVAMLNNLLVPAWFPPLHYFAELAVLVTVILLCIQLARPAAAEYFRLEVEKKGTDDGRVWSTSKIRRRTSTS
jgi:hypothetical protein